MRPPHKCNGSTAYIPFIANGSIYGNYDELNSTLAPFEEMLGEQIGVMDWISVTMNAIVFILATLGNVFVIATLLMSEGKISVTNRFLLSLAVSDLMVALFCIPITTVGKLKAEFIFGEAICKVFGYLMNVSVAISSFTMVAISLERYFAICMPLAARRWQTRSHARKVIIVVWILSSILMSPLLFFLRVIRVPIARLKICNKACRTVFPIQNEDDFSSDSIISAKAWYLFMMVALLGIPGILMSVAYGCICRKIYSGFDFKPKQETNDGTATPRFHRGGRSPMDSKEVNTKNHTNNQNKNCESENSASSHEQCGRSLLKPPDYDRPQSRSDERPRKTKNTDHDEERLKVVKMLILIVVLFFVCWTPTFVANVWKSFDPRSASRLLQGIPINITQILIYVSSCINPVVYCFLNKRFRQAFLNAFSACCAFLPERFKPETTAMRRNAVTQYTGTTSITVTTRD